MYQTDYFVRFVIDKNQARRDLRRGYSFSSYIFRDTKADARELWQEQGIKEPALGRCTHGWGLKLSGLCGFGTFETVREAKEFAGGKTVQYSSYQDWPFAAIYEGKYTGEADGGDGDLFRAIKLVEIIKLH